MPRTVFEHNWVLGELIGSGRHGKVYRATSRETSSAVAVKMEPRDGEFNLLRGEYKVYQRLHASGDVPWIPTVSFIGRNRGKNVMVMTLLGPSLSDRLREAGGRLSVKSVIMVGLQVVNCLAAVHDQGYIHRDVSPANLLTGGSSGRQIYLADFGLAQLFLRSSGAHIGRTEGLCLVGTPSFASINAHHGRQLSRRDDLESLGYTMFYLLYGHVPWDGMRHDSREIVSSKMGVFNSPRTAQFLQFFFNYVQYCDFAERPQYEFLSNNLVYALSCEYCERNDGNFEWVQGSGADDTS